MTTSTTTVRKPRKTAAAAAPIELDAEQPVTPPDRFPIFKLNGVQYYAAMSVPVNVELRFLHLARTQGAIVANAYLVEAVLGPEAYEALMGYEALTRDELRRITRLALDTVNNAADPGPKDGLSIG